MSVYKRKHSAFYWCSFSIGGRRYQQSTGCFTKADAHSFEHTEIQRVKRLVELGKVKDAVRKDHFLGDRIRVDEAWDKFRGLSGKRSRAEEREAATKSRWEDFIAFLKAQYPQVTLVCDVSPKAAQEYIAHIRSSGRWQKKVEYKRPAPGTNGTPASSDTITYTPTVVRLSTATQNTFLQTAQMVFARLMTVDLAITDNPFAAIEPVTNMPAERDYFEVDEIVKLYELARAHPDRDILLPLIVIGAGMALREGDIATLRWRHIDFKNGFMIRETEKTGKGVVFPIWDNAILKFLEDTKVAQGDPAPGDHCFSVLANMYLNNRSGVSYRFKKFLESAGYKDKATVEIRDRKNVKVRDRAVSKLDVHSLRHSFAAIAGAAGLPLKTVQALLGHTSDRTTQIYMRHVNDQELKDKLALMPRLFGGTVTKALPAPAIKTPTAEEIGETIKLLEGATAKGWKKARDRALAILGQVPKP